MIDGSTSLRHALLALHRQVQSSSQQHAPVGHLLISILRRLFSEPLTQLITFWTFSPCPRSGNLRLLDVMNCALLSSLNLITIQQPMLLYVYGNLCFLVRHMMMMIPDEFLSRYGIPHHISSPHPCKIMIFLDTRLTAERVTDEIIKECVLWFILWFIYKHLLFYVQLKTR